MAEEGEPQTVRAAEGSTASSSSSVPQLVPGSGASPFGNFHNYYAFNPVEQRFKYLPDDFFRTVYTLSASTTTTPTLSYLDVGCNEGNITFALADLATRQLAEGKSISENQSMASEGEFKKSTLPSISPLLIRGLGIDIDCILIARAKKKLAAFNSSLNTKTTPSSTSSAKALLFASSIIARGKVEYDIAFTHANIMDEGAERLLDQFNTTKTGAFSTDDSRNHSSGEEKNNHVEGADAATSKRHCPSLSSATNTASTDDAATSTPTTTTTTTMATPLSSSLLPPRFNIVFCFSVTMWIHLHHGDDGLRRFLDLLSARAEHLVVEPQPWKCYLTCKKRWRKSKQPDPPMLSTIQWRNDVDDQIVSYLESECGFKVLRRLGETHWERQLVWLVRKELLPPTDVNDVAGAGKDDAAKNGATSASSSQPTATESMPTSSTTTSLTYEAG